MKKKLLSTTLFALVTALCCTVGLTACGDGNKPDEPSAFDKAYNEYYKTENMAVTVTDSRVEKIGNDYSATVEVDYANKATHTKGSWLESYSEITGDEDNRSFFIYSQATYDMNGEIVKTDWEKLNRSDLYVNWNESGRFASLREFEVHLLTNWVDTYLPAPLHFADTGWRANENEELHQASLLNIFNQFTETANGYTADVYFCINHSSTGYFTPYACTLTIQFDAQGRFANCELDFGDNGKITAAYSYGGASVTIPAEARNSVSAN